MKRKVILILLVGLIMMKGVVIANSGSAQISLPTGQVWVHIPGSRTTSYSYVLTLCNAVWPLEGNDDYTMIQAAVYRDSPYADRGDGPYIVSDVVVLREGEGYKNIYLWEGNLDIYQFKFSYRGNNPSYSAQAIVYYDGK